MRTRSSFVSRGLVVVAVLVLTASAPHAQRPGGPPADTLVAQVRTALGHGAPDQARQIVAGASAATPPAREFASALIEIYDGKDDAARARLEPLANAKALGDEALELGLLDMRHGRRADAHRRLDPIVSAVQAAHTRGTASVDDYYRLARASRAVHEYMLANDAYNRVSSVPRADVQTDWADLFLEHYQPGDAMNSYEPALKADPSWVRAHLGVARALADENPQESRAAFEAARKLAPDAADVWLLDAERQLDGEDIPAAKAALDRAAAARPGSIEEAALRAAVAYGLRHPAEVDAAIARVKEINPTSADGYRQAGEQAARNYRFDDAAALAAKGAALDPDDATVHFDLGLYLMRTGDEKGARAALEHSWTLDKTNRVAKNLLDSLDTLDTFDVVPDGEMIFKFAKNETAVLKPYALPLAERAYKTYQTRYGFTPKGPILIEVFPKHDDFAVRTVGLEGIVGALGACFGRVISMDSPEARPTGEFSWHATLWHEMAHVFTLQLSDFRVPRWLTEGISVFEEHRLNPAWGREITLQFARVLGKGKTFGVKGLPEAFKNPENFSLAYFEASLAVEHLVELNGDAGLRTLLLAYANGADDATAFSKAFGKSIDDVDASFRAFEAQHFGALRDAMGDAPMQVDPDDVPLLRARATGAPGNFVSQLTLGQALLKTGDLAGAQTALERAAQLAPQATGNASPHALLAQIAVQQGDKVRARKELRELLAYDHSNVTAARTLVTLAVATNAPDDQEFGLRVVADVAPFDAETHNLLGKREFARKEYEPALTEFQVALALVPANLAEAHSDVAEVLLAMGRKDEAKHEAILALIEAPTFARAQDLLLAALGKGAGER